MKYHIIICAILKDETPYLTEWIEHHLEIGIEHFVLYDNNSAIPARQTLDSYVKKGIVEVLDCRITNAPQLKAYMHCLYRMHDHTDWIAYIDIDEFIILKKHHDIRRFLENYKNFAGICLNWVIYTANNHLSKPEGPVMQNYTEFTSADFPPNRHVKTIVQPKCVNIIDNPHYPQYNEGRYAVNERYTYVSHACSEFSNELAQINHYFTKSFEEWLCKIGRGEADSTHTREVGEFWSYNPGMLHLKEEAEHMFEEVINNYNRSRIK